VPWAASRAGPADNKECSQDADCDIRNSTCQQGVCRCVEGEIVTSDMTRCLTGKCSQRLGDFVQEDCGISRTCEKDSRKKSSHDLNISLSTVPSHVAVSPYVRKDKEIVNCVDTYPILSLDTV